MKKNIIVLVIIIIVGAGIYLFTKGSFQNVSVKQDKPVVTDVNLPTSTEPVKNEIKTNSDKTVIGKSVDGLDITAYHFGKGEKELLFIGGIHGGYEWNTVLVANQMMDYLKSNPDAIPDNVKVTVIPVMNPDGLNKVVGTPTGNFTKADVPSQSDTVTGRFNSNIVDLNRNFDCDWQSKATWQNKSVSGGSKAFSEPESQAIKNYVEANQPAAVIVWYSSAGGVFASSCHNGVSAGTNMLMKTYADASGYPAHKDFNFYEITGDMVNWFAKNDIPAVSVLLTNHTDTEWTKNLAGIKAVFKYYSK